MLHGGEAIFHPLQFFCAINPGASPASRDRGGAKLKSWGQRFSPKCKGFFWPKSQIFLPKAGDLQIKKKKKVFAEIRRLFLAEIANFNVFSAQIHQLFSPKKIPWETRKKSGGGGAKTKMATRLDKSPQKKLLLF